MGAGRRISAKESGGEVFGHGSAVCDFCGSWCCDNVGVMVVVGRCHCLCGFISGEDGDFCKEGASLVTRLICGVIVLHVGRLVHC